ncbi:phosphoribosylglycinamide formyltransferase [Alkaliphilus pronyensis]|uniref:Phosphoribosylglycinamide formyltransferase n=1 Tax=Alkaliphilus pronyensis TaxID=1482732 RepID=A0A6I0F8N5_9FIRM|nr:phosphoribosylglycinamide formyltransferase [Alkaliphilus pronyensis]KAB3534438.1 phosphoribosylglycinamide formyltransferase [Alkaliphilus pronyensis]
MSKLRLAVLISGGGTNLQAIIDGVEKGYINGSIDLVISSNRNAYGLKRAENHNIPTMIIDKSQYPCSEKRQNLIYEVLKAKEVGLVVLAGYLEIISNQLIEAFKNRIINVHPSLIPSFSGRGFFGDKVHKDAIRRGVKISGATVHFVNEETDGGPIILQKSVEVSYRDEVKDLKEKVLKIEHIILTEAIKLFSEDRIEVVNNRVRIK